MDVLSILEEALFADDDWGKDGLLHASTDLVGPLRHTMLRMAGAPQKPETFAGKMTLLIGQLIHDWAQDALEGYKGPVMREVSINDGLPEGWGGTADTLVWSRPHRAYILYDYKTNKGEGIKYIEQDGAKLEHIWQVSAYWHALVAMGYPMVKVARIIYLPKNDVYGDEPSPQPQEIEVYPLPKEQLWQEMAERKKAVDEYLRGLGALDDDDRWDMISAEMAVRGTNIVSQTHAFYVTPELAPPTPREQKLAKDKDKWNVILVPHWTAQFCKYDDDLCACGGEPGADRTTKVGHFEKVDGEWVYNPRKGYELVEPEVQPYAR